MLDEEKKQHYVDELGGQDNTKEEKCRVISDLGQSSFFDKGRIYPVQISRQQQTEMVKREPSTSTVEVSDSRLATRSSFLPDLETYSRRMSQVHNHIQQRM